MAQPKRGGAAVGVAQSPEYQVPRLGPPALTVSGLSKRFRLPEHRQTSLREVLLHPARNRDHDWLTALEDVSFEVERGSCLGIVGRNGSGKSTLLRCLAGIYPPTVGQVNTSGRVAAFIELGVGFDREETARENLITGGMLFGLTAATMRERVEPILAYGGLEEFADVKLKNFSSGMSTRLAFALTTHIDADVLLFDEVIATGDLAFQRKCFDRITALREEGRTLVLVSHDMAAIESLCDRGILLERGRVEYAGDAPAAAEHYDTVNLASSATWSERSRTPRGLQPPPASGDSAISSRVEASDRGGAPRAAGWRHTARIAVRFALLQYKRKYADAAVGYAWAVLRPLATFAAMYLVFTRIAHFNAGVHHYAVYLLTSLVLWTFFVDATTSALFSLVGHAEMLRKIPVSGFAMPLAVVLRALLDLVMNLVAVAVFVAISGISPKASWLELPPLILAVAGIATAVALLTSSLYVRLRDVSEVWLTLSQMLFFASPILYVVSSVPSNLRPILTALNPLASIFTQMRHALIDPAAPTAAAAAGGTARLLFPTAITLLLLLAGVGTFWRLAPMAPENL